MEPWREKYLVFGSPYLGAEERAEVLACFDSRWLGTGPRVARLEEQFRAYLDVPAAVAVSSGTAALHLALLELRLPPGSDVLVPAMTFAATANAVIHAGHRPVFVDCDRGTLNVTALELERRLTPGTRAIVPVHFAGRPCEMEEIGAFARRHDLRVVEDCAHAIEAQVGGRHCGTFGDFGCFSLYVTKNVTSAEGGIVVARTVEQAARIQVMALHGMSKDAWRRFSDQGYVHYEVVAPGFKYNLTDLAASIGIHQLARVEQLYLRRRALWDRYQRELAGLPLHLPAAPAPGTRHALHLFTCLVDDTRTAVTRDQVRAGLHRLRVGAGVHYRALHLMPYYREAFGTKEGDCPNAEWVGARTFSIPFSAAVDDEDAGDVILALRAVLGAG